MPSMLRRDIGFIASLMLLATVALFPLPASANEDVNIVDGYAVHGYDVVAYFVAGEPTQGVDEYTAEYQGAVYRFSSAENKALFESEPSRFVPEYGGFCALGTAMGRKVDGDPLLWSIRDGKLYLNLNDEVQTMWQEDPAAFIRGADHNWSLISGYSDDELADNPPAGLSLGKQ